MELRDLVQPALSETYRVSFLDLMTTPVFSHSEHGAGGWEERQKKPVSEIFSCPSALPDQGHQSAIKDAIFSACGPLKSHEPRQPVSRSKSLVPIQGTSHIYLTSQQIVTYMSHNNT